MYQIPGYLFYKEAFPREDQSLNSTLTCEIPPT